MVKHDYTAEEALQLLLDRIAVVSTELHDRMQSAIDAGHEVQIIDESTAYRTGKKTARYYWKNARYDVEDALSVAIGVLEAHLVEVPMFANTAALDFVKAGVAGVKPADPDKARADAAKAALINVEKTILIEIEPETVRKPSDIGTVRLPTASREDVQTLRDIIERLRELVDFSGK